MAMQRNKLGDLLAGNILLRLLNIICGVLITLILTRLMGTAGYGTLSLLIANAALFNLLTCMGAESGIVYHYSSGRLNKSSIISIVYFVLFIQALLLFVVEAVYKNYTGSYWIIEGDANSFLIWGLAYFISIALTDKYTALLNAAHYYTLANKLILAGNLVTVLVFMSCIIWRRESIVLYLQLYIACAILQAIILLAFFHLRTGQGLKFGPLAGQWKAFFSYSGIVLITNIIQFLAYRIDYWIIDYYHDKNELGLYSLAVKFGQMLWFLPLLLAGILFPRIAGKADPGEEQRWEVLIRLMMSGFFVCIILSGLLSFWLIPLLAGEDFSGSVWPFINRLPGLLFFCYNIIFAAYFAGISKLNINLRGSVLCLALVVIADFILIPRWGATGASLASTIAYTAAGFHHLYMYAKIKNVSLFSMITANRDDWKIAVAYLGKYLK